MQIILLEKVVNLGGLGDVVKVKDGYARNYLIPQGKAKRANAANLAEPGVERGKNIELFYSEYGNVKVRVTAPTVTRFLTDNPYTEFNDGLKVDFYNDSLRVTSNLTANYGIRYENEMKTIMRNDVQVVNENNEHLSTEELIWDEKNHRIYSDKFVKITTPDQVIYGEGMEADEQLTTYKIKKPQGTIRTEMDATESEE